MRFLTIFTILSGLVLPGGAVGQDAPPALNPLVFEIVDAVSADRIEADIRTLVGFGTRNTFSDTVSSTRGIGAARRWIKGVFDEISAACGACLDVMYISEVIPASHPNEPHAAKPKHSAP